MSLKIESLESLNDTIDQLFAELEHNSGDTSLLEDLCPYFGIVWPSARALSKHLAETLGSQLKNQNILEIGCGLALPSLVCAHYGANVTATDFHPDIQRFLKPNLEQNGITNLRYVEVDWGAAQLPSLGLFDRVIGSDILYESAHPKKVARTLAEHVMPGGEIIIADPARPYLQAFVQEMHGLGFESKMSVKTVADTEKPGANKDVFVLVFKRKLN